MKKLTAEQTYLKSVLDVIYKLNTDIAKEKFLSYGEGMIAMQKFNSKEGSR